MDKKIYYSNYTARLLLRKRVVLNLVIFIPLIVLFFFGTSISMTIALVILFWLPYALIVHVSANYFSPTPRNMKALKAPALELLPDVLRVRHFFSDVNISIPWKDINSANFNYDVTSIVLNIQNSKEHLRDIPKIHKILYSIQSEGNYFIPLSLLNCVASNLLEHIQSELGKSSKDV